MTQILIEHTEKIMKKSKSNHRHDHENEFSLVCEFGKKGHKIKLYEPNNDYGDFKLGMPGLKRKNVYAVNNEKNSFPKMSIDKDDHHSNHGLKVLTYQQFKGEYTFIMSVEHE